MKAKGRNGFSGIFRGASSPPRIRRPKLSGAHADVAIRRSMSGVQVKGHQIDYLCVPEHFNTGHIYRGPDRGARGIPKSWTHYRGHEISHGRCPHHAAITVKSHKKRKQ